MITVKDIAKIIATRYSLSNVEAEIFMQMIVEVINDGLLQDRQVKIKGFGTFKLQAVKERNSVNVNTGEKVVIAEHDKITFVPDAVMKDLINKPFAQFETVIVDENSPLLNDDTNLDEVVIDSTTHVIEHSETEQQGTAAPVVPEGIETNEKSSSEKSVTTPYKGTNSENEEIPANNISSDDSPCTDTYEQKSTTEEEPSVSDEREKIVDKQDTAADKQEEQKVPTDEQTECEHPLPRCRNIFIYYGILINIVVAIIAFTLGYMASSYGIFSEKTKEVTAKEVKKQVTRKKPFKKVIIKNNNTTPPQQNEDSLKNITKKQEEKNTSIENNEVDIHKYDEDVRVRTGAYYITGTNKEVTVKEGQTIASISRQYLGEGMECYVEVYNGIKDVRKGDVIKIPELKLKKKRN